MYCNFPGTNGADEHALLIQAHNMNTAEFEAGCQCDSTAAPDEQGTEANTCKNGYCKTDWKPAKELQQ